MAQSWGSIGGEEIQVNHVFYCALVILSLLPNLLFGQLSALR